MDELCTTECVLCSMVQNATSSNPNLENTLLYETEHFVITPSIGPLTAGHILITSKLHYPSLASMDISKILEFKELYEKLVSYGDRKLLLSEHGTFNGDKGGSCIDHTHIHVIPNMSKYVNILDGILNKNNKINNIAHINSLNNIDYPYIMNLNSNGEINIYEAYNRHSQILRKAICHSENRSDWNWRSYDKTHFLKETLIFWSNYF